MEQEILDTYFKDHFYPFTKHHIDSYREFLRRYIPDVIKTYNPITMVKFKNNNIDDLEVKVELFIGGENGTDIYIDRPTTVDNDGKPIILTPQDARLKNLTYTTRLYADILIKYTIGKDIKIDKRFPHILLGEIPLMVHSDGCILHQQGPKVLKAFDECPYDQGGYFIIDGKEKVIISQERMVTNRLFIEEAKDPKYSYKGWVRSATDEGENALLPKTVEFYLSKNNINGTEFTHGPIEVSVPKITKKIPLFILFRAFGIENDKEILETIFGDVSNLSPEYIDIILPSLKDIDNIYSQKNAIDSFKNYTRYQSNEFVHSILTQDVFPNMGEDYTMKSRFLGYLVKYMIDMVLNVRSHVERDNYGLKRIDLSGFLLSQLFHNIYKRFKKNCRDLLDQEYHYGPTRNTGKYEFLIRDDNIQKIISPYFISERMIRSLKGLWGSSDQDEKQEKVQDLSRISYIGYLSNLRRVNTPLDRSIKITSPHRLNAQQWGIICPFESPDGASIGYLKNFALLANVSFGTNPDELIKEPDNCLRELGLIPLNFIDAKTSSRLTKIFLNGKWIGCHNQPDIFTHRLRLLRRNGLINIFISVAWQIKLNEIRINTDPGRACRPVLIKHTTEIDMSKNPTWFELVFGSLLPKESKSEDLYYNNKYLSPFKMSKFNGKNKDDVFKELEKTQCIVEFLDIEEEDTRLIAMNKENINNLTTHYEINPSTILSVVSSNIPFANHNQAPRNIFYGAQSKQAVGIYTTNFSKRFDTMGYVMHYPEKPLITTQNSHYISNDKLPTGFNTIVAIMTNTGFNQEDGIIINKTAVERGLFQITSYRSYGSEETAKNKREYTIITNPVKLKNDENVNIKNMRELEDYQLLDNNGIAVPGSYVKKGSKTPIIGMVEIIESVKEVQKGIKIESELVKSYRDVSITTGVHHYGTIDKIYLDNKGSLINNSKVCKIRFRKVRKPELGDKMCSRHGQKGVCGMVLPEEDMPFTKDGMVPDIIINPHAIPSRMTIGHLVECVFAKLCTLEGYTGDGSVFVNFDMDKIGNVLEDTHNYNKYGNEIMYNGRTGQQIDTEIFFGPTYYLRLKHMVADKVHQRDKGPRDQMTMQPTTGRGKEGGLRIGEMERDVLISYGFSQFLKESMMERSDKYTWAVCRGCGRIAIYSSKDNISKCLTCDNNDIAIVQTPFSFKLLVQELETMGITPRFVMDDIEMDIDEEDIPSDDEDIIINEKDTININQKETIEDVEEQVVNNNKNKDLVINKDELEEFNINETDSDTDEDSEIDIDETEDITTSSSEEETTTSSRKTTTSSEEETTTSSEEENTSSSEEETTTSSEDETTTSSEEETTSSSEDETTTSSEEETTTSSEEETTTSSEEENELDIDESDEESISDSEYDSTEKNSKNEETSQVKVIEI
jgi:DNA-directed RNA polymerase II subunit RPB2